MDVPRIDAWLLHCLAVLVRQSNVTRAGAELGLSQPACSSTLARLRLLFQDPLLVKSGSGMVPTARAMELATRAEKVLDELRAMVSVNPALDPLALEANVTIAAMDLVRMVVLPHLLESLRQEAPGLSIQVQDADRVRIHERFEHAEVDLGIGPKEVTSGRLHYRELWVDGAACLTRDSSLAHGSMDVAGFAALQHVRVVPSRPSFYDDALDRTLQEQGFRRQIAISERSFLMIPRLLESADLVATVPRRFALDACERYDLHTFAPPVTLPELSMGMYWHERTHRDPMYQWLRQRIATNVASSLTHGQA